MLENELKISEENLERLKKYCQENGDKISGHNLNVHLDDILDQAFFDLDGTNKRKKWIEEDKAKMKVLQEIAKQEGIKIPNLEIFHDSDSLKGFLLVKIFINDTALEKICQKLLPFYDKIPMEEFAESIGDLMKNKPVEEL